MATTPSGITYSTGELIERLIGFDTVSSRSNLALIDFVRDYLASWGVPSRLIHNAERTKANLYATVGPQERGGVVLSGHTDVVPVADQDWSRDPFRLHRADGRLYGRGTTDMKSFIAIVLARVPAMLASPLETPLHLALSYDEEVGCVGVPDLIRDIASQAGPAVPHMAIIGEPTGMKVIAGHKGVWMFETLVTGHEAHSSQTQLGVSAIMAGAQFVSFLAGLAEEMKAADKLDPAFEPPWTSIHVGQIQGGTAHNIIPGRCRIGWEIRPLPGEDAAALAGRAAAYARDVLEPAMRMIAPGCAIVTQPGVRVAPLRPDGNARVQNLARALTGENSVGMVSFGTEAGLFQDSGIEAVVCGPGHIAQAHQPDEYIALAQVEKCEAFVDQLIVWARANRPA
ncbi:MAG: acetylornithine deacetylase [Alphaproteobacteria bacterium]